MGFGENEVNSTSEDARFGYLVGAVCLTLAVYQVGHRGEVAMGALVLGVVGLVLVVLARVWPRALLRPNAVWTRIARILGWINTRLLLTVVFFFMLVPLALIWRLIGRDPLQARRTASSGWHSVPLRYRNRDHLERMF